MDLASKSLVPPPRLTLPEWAERHAYLSPEASAISGKWHSYPYQVGIMEAMTDPAVEEVVLIKSARLGFTKILGHLIAYHMSNDPCPILMVQPTVEDAAGWSKDELGPMIRDTAGLSDLVSPEKSRDSSNTILKKLFVGGQIMIVGANSARGFRRVTARVVIFDEVDGYPAEGAGQEGDQISLGKRRSDTYWNRKIVLGSTPTVQGLSRIEKAYNDSDQRRYFVPCLKCGTYQILRFSQLKWPHAQPGKAEFECTDCTRMIPYSDQRQMVSEGEWRATAPFLGRAGFAIWAAYSYSPNATWGQLATEFREVHKDPVRLRTYVNTVLGEVSTDAGEEVDEGPLMARCEPFSTDPVPEEVVAMTIGADVQGDRIEAELVGWGRANETWSLDYRVFLGDPSRPELWEEVDVWIAMSYETADGRVLIPRGTLIDSGDQTQAVYSYCQGMAKMKRGIYASKGMSVQGYPVASSPIRSGSRKARLVRVGTDTAKEMIYARLHIEEPGPGYCHFPNGREAEYFLQLTAEKRVTKFEKGISKAVWRKKRSRNEALDCRVYAMAAKELMRYDLDALADRVAADRGDDPEPPAELTAREQAAKIREGRKPKRKGGWARNW